MRNINRSSGNRGQSVIEGEDQLGWVVLGIVDLDRGVGLHALGLTGTAQVEVVAHRTLVAGTEDWRLVALVTADPSLHRGMRHGTGGDRLGTTHFVNEVLRALGAVHDFDHGERLVGLQCLAGSAEVVVVAAGALEARSHDGAHFALVAAHSLVHI